MSNRTQTHKKASSKLPAFTIIEVTIAMVIAGISIAIAFTAYRLVSQSYKQYDDKNKKLAEAMLLNKLLSKDFLQSQQVISTVDGLLLKMPGGEINYHFQPEFILRDQYGLETDTFFIAASQPHCLFKGNDAAEGDLTDQLTFSARVRDESLAYGFNKEYSSEELFSLKPNN